MRFWSTALGCGWQGNRSCRIHLALYPLPGAPSGYPLATWSGYIPCIRLHSSQRVPDQLFICVDGLHISPVAAVRYRTMPHLRSRAPHHPKWLPVIQNGPGQIGATRPCMGGTGANVVHFSKFGSCFYYLKLLNNKEYQPL